MNTTDFNYRIQFRLNGLDKRIIVLSQIPIPKGEENVIEIPEEDLETVIMKLSNIRSIVDDPIIPFEEHENRKVELEPNIIQTLVALFLSGVSIGDLSKQYDYSEDLIRYHLEDKGIVIFDEI
jgi:hypothetical protein